MQDQVATLTTDLANIQKGLQATLSDARLLAQQTSLTKQLTDASDKMSEAGLSANSVGTGVGLFAPPDTPSAPTSPRPALAAVIGLFLGSFLGGLLAWLLARLHDRRTTPTLATLGLRRLGRLDGHGTGNDLMAADAALSVVLELPPDGQVIALLPAGNATTAMSGLELATALDATGQSVAVLDGARATESTTEGGGGGRDAKGRPAAARHLASDPDAPVSALKVFPRGPPGAPLWPSDMDNLIGQLRKSYQIVVVATGPMSSPESRLLLSRSDVGVLVLAEGVEALPPADVAWLRRVATPVVGYLARLPAGSEARSGVRRLGAKQVSESPAAFSYPGDESVDIVGLDVYDTSFGQAGVTAQERSTAQLEDSGGIMSAIDLARRHGKPVSFPEWALVAAGNPAGSNGAGDNARFVAGMADVMRRTAMAYQAYFNVVDGGVGMTISDAPQSLVVFRQRFGVGGDV
jgi:hypothetical protein